MTTIEFLKDVFKDGPSDHGKFYDYTLHGKQILDKYKEEILKLEELWKIGWRKLISMKKILHH